MIMSPVFLKSGSSRTSWGGGNRTGGFVGSCFFLPCPLWPGCPPGAFPVFSRLLAIFLGLFDFEDGMDEFSKSRLSVIQHFIYSQNHSTHVKFNKAPESNKVTYIPSDSLIPEPFMLLLSRTNEKRQATTVQSRPVFPQTAPGVKLPCALTSI